MRTLNELIQIIGQKGIDNWALMGSKWQNCECEVIVAQTVNACAFNLEKHGEAFSWLNENATRGRQISGVNNAGALKRLIDDGSITAGDYTGDATPPDGTVHIKGIPQVVRVTESLLSYVIQHAKIKIS